MIRKTESGRFQLTTLDDYGEKIRSTHDTRAEAKEEEKERKLCRAEYKYFWGKQPRDPRCTHKSKAGKRCRRIATERNASSGKRVCPFHT